jgi:hypothetical protein
MKDDTRSSLVWLLRRASVGTRLAGDWSGLSAGFSRTTDCVALWLARAAEIDAEIDARDATIRAFARELLYHEMTDLSKGCAASGWDASVGTGLWDVLAGRATSWNEVTIPATPLWRLRRFTTLAGGWYDDAGEFVEMDKWVAEHGAMAEMTEGGTPNA